MSEDNRATTEAPAEPQPSSQTTSGDSLREQIDQALPSDPERALALAQKATELDPADPGAWFIPGMILANKLGRPADALPYLAKALELNPNDAQTWLGQGEVYRALGRLPEAADAFRHVTTIEGGNRDAWLGLAEALASHGEPKAAADALAGATKAVPEFASDPEVMLALAGYLVQEESYHEALSSVDSLASVAMNDQQKSLEWFWRGRALQGLGNNRDAADAFVKAQPGLPSQLKGPGFYFQAVSLNEIPDPAGALQAVAQAEQLPLDNAGRGFLMLERGKALLASGEPQPAIAALRGAADLLPPGVALSNCWMQIGVAHNNLGEFENAVEALDRSIAADPEGADAAHIRIIAGFNKAIAEYQLQQTEKALQALDAALEDSARYPHALPAPFRSTLLISRANMLVMFRRFEEARAALVEAQELSPDLAADLQFWVVKTNTAFFAGHADEALAPPPPGIKDHPLVLATRGTLLNATGALDQGRAELARAAACAPNCGDDPMAWVGAGLAELALYQWQSAADALTKARGLSRQVADDFSVGYGLGVALLALGKPQEAWGVLEHLPETNDTLQAKASALQGIGDNPNAMKTMERVVEPDHSAPLQTALSYWLWRGNMLVALGQSHGGLTAFEKASQLAADPAGALLRVAAAVGLASALIKLNRREDALAWLAEFTAEPAVPGAPRAGGAWWLMGALLAEKERFEEALRAVTVAEALQPDDEDILLSKGRALLNLEDYDQAKDVFLRALALAQKPDEQFEACVGAGNALNGLELYETAVHRFRQGLGKASEHIRKDPRVWLGLGRAYRCLGRFQAAYRTLEEGWRLNSRKSADLVLAMAEVLLDQQRDREARDFLISAQSEKSPDPQIDLSLGVALYRLKDRSGAQRVWQRAKDRGSQPAAEYLESIPKAAPDPSDLLGYWFGDAASKWRKIAGSALALLILIAASLPVISKDAIHWLRWLTTGDNYKMGWITLAALLLVFLAPVLKSIKLDVGPLKLEAATPEITAKPDVDALLDKLKASGLGAGVQSGVGSGLGGAAPTTRA